jgi:prepilin-type N-terminal cleavage/methylation domain-containing protein
MHAQARPLATPPRRPPEASARPAAGVTLIEILVVIAILSVVAALGAGRMTRRDLRGSAAGLAQELYVRASAARGTALTTGCQTALVLDPLDADGDGQVAALLVATTPGFGATVSFAPSGDAVTGRSGARVMAVASGTDLSGTAPAGPATPDAVVFLPDGSARLRSTGQAGATLYVRDRDGKNPYRIAIFGRTGFAKLLAQ